MAVSTVSDKTLEEIAAAADGPKWFQLYWPVNRKLAASLLARAEACRLRALIVTLDAFLPGWKPRDLVSGWQPFLQHRDRQLHVGPGIPSAAGKPPGGPGRPSGSS